MLSGSGPCQDLPHWDPDPVRNYRVRIRTLSGAIASGSGILSGATNWCHWHLTCCLWWHLPSRWHLTSYQGWARNFKNVAPQKQNTIWKRRAQYTKRISFFEIRISIGLGVNMNRFWFNNFWDPHDLITKTAFSRSSEETLLEKFYFQKIFLIKRNLFLNIFLTLQIYFENLFLNH